MDRRDFRIDVLRGLALLMIFVDHVPKNPVSRFTLQSLSFADAAELFFFLSGFVAAAVYGRKLELQGFVHGAAHIWRRAWDIYAAHIVLLLFFIATVSAIASITGNPSYFGIFRSSAFVMDTENTIVQAMLLNFQPAYMDILPVYILFFATLPFLLMGLKHIPWLVLAASLALYAGSNLFGWNLTTHPRSDGWFFNPFAWQILMVAGAVFGLGLLDRFKPIIFSRCSIALCGVVAAVACVMQFTNNMNVLYPWFPSLYLVHVPVSKTWVEPMRLVSFFAMAVLVIRYMPTGAKLAKIWGTKALACCGRHSLAIFCLGVLLSLLGHVAWYEGGQSYIVQTAYSLVGITLLIASATLLDWLRQTLRKAAPFSDSKTARASA